VKLPPLIILASGSPRRAALMRQMGATFEVHQSSIEEDIHQAMTPDQLVQHLALEKALDVKKNIRRGVIVGADTIVVIDNTILTKPVDAADAVRMLKTLSGRTHTVYTGFAVCATDSDRCECGVEATHVTFRILDDDEISD